MRRIPLAALMIAALAACQQKPAPEPPVEPVVTPAPEPVPPVNPDSPQVIDTTAVPTADSAAQ